MTRALSWASIAAAALTVLGLHGWAGGDPSGSTSRRAQAASRATAADTPATVAVRLLTGLAGGDPRTAATVVDSTATPSFADLLSQRWRSVAAGRPHLRQRLTVTNVAVRVDGRRADVQVVGQLTTSGAGTAPLVVAVAWRCALVDEPDLGWRVRAVS